MVEASATVLWIAAPNGTFTSPQESWEAYTGQSFEQHRDLGWTDAIHPDDLPALLERWTAAVELGGSFTSEGRMWCAATQSFRRFQCKATALHNPDGSVREWVGASADIEDRE